MRRSRGWRISGLLAALLALLPPVPAQAAEALEARVIRIVPDEGTITTWEGRPYGGPIEIRAFSDGLAVIEEVTLDEYLLGIQEVPFSWEVEALRAQAVAARTYLAWTLAGGRRGSAATYGFDICATAACQVYRGLGQVRGPGGERWQEAVESTAGEVLLFDGQPAQTLYSSTMGSRTRNVEDVFVGSSPRPYLQAVDNPEEDSPFVEWEFDVPEGVMVDILNAGDVPIDRLLSMSVETAPDGQGPWTVEIFGLGPAGGVSQSFDTWRFRGLMNREGPEVAPDLLPAPRPDADRRYPTVLLSPSYTVDRTLVFEEGGGFRIPELVYRFRGEGWGHNIGMSQYGAQALAVGGIEYDEILAYYYGGLAPEPGVGHLPDTVEVGLAWGAGDAQLFVDGPATVFVDGLDIDQDFPGTWTLSSDRGRLSADPPAGLGVPRDLAALSVPVTRPGLVVITAVLPSEGEVRLVVFDDQGVVDTTPWRVESGSVVYLHEGPDDVPLRYIIQLRSGSAVPGVGTLR